MSAPLPWILSAPDEGGLRAGADELHAHLLAHPQLDPADVGWSLARRPQLDLLVRRQIRD